MLVGATLVFLKFSKMEREKELLAEYHAEDVGEAAGRRGARRGDPTSSRAHVSPGRGSVPAPNWAAQSTSFW